MNARKYPCILVERVAPARTVWPTRPLTGKKFRYVPAALTDIRKTFEKARRLASLKRGAA